MIKELDLAVQAIDETALHLRSAHTVCKNEFAEIVLRDLLEETIELHRKIDQACAASKI